MSPIRILELRSVVGSGGGPEKTILYGTARTDPSEFDITVCYLRDQRDQAYDLAERAGRLNLKYSEIIERSSVDLRVWPQLLTLCRTHQFDIVHAHEYKTDLLAWLLSKRAGIVPLATAHGWTGHSWKERRVYYPADKRILARFPRVIAVSGDVRDALTASGSRADRISVVLNGIEARDFVRKPELVPAVREELGIPPSAFVVGSVGRLEPQKRFDLLLEAVAQLRPENREMYLLIAGTGSLDRALAEQVKRLDLASRVRLLGHWRDVPRLHHALDLFVQASDYEGTSNAVLEAMAMETPVVATDVGGTAELVRDGVDGLIIPPGSVAKLAGSMALLAGDRELRRKFAVSSRQRVEGPLSFSQRMLKVEQIYRDLMRTRTALHA